MGAVLILYGSRARGEARKGSDVDLLLAEKGAAIGTPHDAHGISVHRYAQDWLKAEARAGSLFAYHIAFEGVPLHDPEHFLPELQASFAFKASYLPDQEMAALILRMLLEQDWRANYEARRRYFWAVRTILISRSADRGNPQFAAAALETLSGISGLASHIENRAQSGFAECARFGALVLAVIPDALPEYRGIALRNYLMAAGGIARDSVRIVEQRDASECGDLQLYS